MRAKRKSQTRKKKDWAGIFETQWIDYFYMSNVFCQLIEFDWFVCSNNVSNWSSSPGFLAIPSIYVEYVSVLISSIHRSSKRSMFDLYLGHPITSDIPTISIRETFCCLPIVPFSFFRSSLYLSIVFALTDDDDEMNIHSFDGKARKKKKYDEDILEQARTDR